MKLKFLFDLKNISFSTLIIGRILPKLEELKLRKYRNRTILDIYNTSVILFT